MTIQEEHVLGMVQMVYLLNRPIEEFLRLEHGKLTRRHMLLLVHYRSFRIC